MFGWHKRGASGNLAPAKLVSGLIFSCNVALDEIRQELEARFCPISSVSECKPFSWTSYYQKEMGQKLNRVFLAFDCLVQQECLVDAKHMSIALESKWRVGGNRQVNVDPGILTAERLVLATTKNFTHRIYLAKGIFADLTLIYRKGGFRPLEWTYPDYREPWSLAFWNKVRQMYLEQLRADRVGQRPQGE